MSLLQREWMVQAFKSTKTEKNTLEEDRQKLSR